MSDDQSQVIKTVIIKQMVMANCFDQSRDNPGQPNNNLRKDHLSDPYTYARMKETHEVARWLVCFYYRLHGKKYPVRQLSLF